MANNPSAEFHCWYAPDRATALQKGQWILSTYEQYILPGRIIDLGCGEGGLLLALREKGIMDIIGVDSNAELCKLGLFFGLPIMRQDLSEFIASNVMEKGTYFYLDVIEHVPFELNLKVFGSLSTGSRLIVQTPFTKSLLGHQYYMNVPSHISPYSPWVIHRMLARLGYRVIAEGNLEGHHPPTWANRLRAVFIRKALGIDPELLLGGGNYFVVADRHQCQGAAGGEMV